MKALVVTPLISFFVKTDKRYFHVSSDGRVEWQVGDMAGNTWFQEADDKKAVKAVRAAIEKAMEEYSLPENGKGIAL